MMKAYREMVVWKERAPLPLPRAGYSSGVLNGKLVVAGGTSWVNDQKIRSDRTDLFDPDANEWLPGPSMPEPRSDAACATINEKLYVFGGVRMDAETRALQNLNDAWSYDTDRGIWTRRPPLPVARRAWGAVAVGDGALLLGGYTDTFCGDIFHFDARSNETREAGEMPHALADARYLRIGSKIFTTGGEAGVKIRGHWTLEGDLAVGAD